jgi:hypothetical protein
VLRQGISYGVHQAIEGHARWNNGQVLGNVATDVATTVAGTAFAAQRQRDAEAQRFYGTAMADGNPFNGGVAGSDSIPDLSTDAGLSAAVAQIWAANADQPMLASGYGHDVDPLHPQSVMSTDGPRLVIGGSDDVSPEDMLQAKLDVLKADGVDVTDLQQELDQIVNRQQSNVSGSADWYRTPDGTLHNGAYDGIPYEGDADQAPLELDIIGGTPESAIAEHARAFDAWRLTGQEYFDQYRGSVLGDLFANAGTIANNGGLTAIQGVSSLIDLVTDGASDREVLTNVGRAIIHPYDHAVAAMTGFYEQPLGEQARIIGSGSVAMLLGGAVKVPLAEAPSVDSLFVNGAARSEAAASIRQARNLLRDAGVPLHDRNQIIRSFDLETFRIETVGATRTEFRLFDDYSAALQGRYVSPDFFASQTDRIVNFALPANSATRLAEVTLPEGSLVFTGRAAPQLNYSPGLIGGANQTFLMGPLRNYQFVEIPMPRP